jgi:hypothetical protein
MFRSFRARELAALAPLLDLARQKTGHERQEWLDDLRTDAPILMARIEAILATEAAEPDTVMRADHAAAIPSGLRQHRPAGGAASWLVFQLRTR